MSFGARVERDTSCISRRRPSHFVQNQRHWRNSGTSQKQVVIKRGEALIPRLPAVYLRFEYRSFQEPERGGFAVKTTAKCTDECLDIVHLQNAKPVVTPLTEPKSANLHDETTVCDQAERVVVGKLQYITGVRPDLLFMTKCLSHRIAPPTPEDLSRAKKALRHLNGTRLYLTIPAMKPTDLSRQLKNITGYSDADWAGPPA